MSARPAPPPAKATIRTKLMKIDWSGSHAGLCGIAFSALDDKPKTRQRVLAELYQQHIVMSEREATAAVVAQGGAA